MTNKTDHQWQRRWLRLFEPSSLRGRATGDQSLAYTPVPLSSLRDVPCLILLGSPGLGKSTEIGVAASDTRVRGEAADVIPLGRLSGPQELEARILGKAIDQSIAQKPWTIFLDGLDEALPQFTKDHTAIASVFRSLSE